VTVAVPDRNRLSTLADIGNRARQLQPTNTLTVNQHQTFNLEKPGQTGNSWL
jgi:hypothetical protein